MVYLFIGIPTLLLSQADGCVIEEKCRTHMLLSIFSFMLSRREDGNKTLIGSLKAGFVTERSAAGSCRAFSVLALLNFIGSLKAGFVTERSGAGSCRAFRSCYTSNIPFLSAAGGV